MGDDRPAPRFYYLDGNLEIMSTSNDHERIKKWIGGFLEIHFDMTGIEVLPRGQATMRQTLRHVGAEPDESWCIGEEKQWPNLVLEVALTSGGLSKLEIYRRFNISEVWLWRDNKLNLFALDATGAKYDPISQSRLLPKLDIPLIEHCVSIRSWQQARKTFRAGLEKAS